MRTNDWTKQACKQASNRRWISQMAVSLQPWKVINLTKKFPALMESKIYHRVYKTCHLALLLSIYWQQISVTFILISFHPIFCLRRHLCLSAFPSSWFHLQILFLKLYFKITFQCKPVSMKWLLTVIFPTINFLWSSCFPHTYQYMLLV